MFTADGKMVASGRWINDQLQSAATSVSAQVAPAASSAVAASASASASSLSSLPVPNRKALLIGNSKYAAPAKSLRCCGTDAEDMRDALQKLGFQCTLLLNATKRRFTDALTAFIASLEKDDIIFIYFSGHGEERAGETYLIPTDYANGNLRDDAVHLGHITSDLHHKDCHLRNIIVMDCCRANEDDATWKCGAESVARSSMESAERGRNGFDRLPSTGHFFIVYSCDPGTVAFESSGERNGWFTGCLLLHLLTPGLHIEQIFKRANAALEKKSKLRQGGWQKSSLKVDVILLPKSTHKGTEMEWDS